MDMIFYFFLNFDLDFESNWGEYELYSGYFTTGGRKTLGHHSGKLPF
jgi:hypothetical protein